jgi:hypothetical protein
MHWRTVVRLDPNKGAMIRGFEELERTVTEGAKEYYGDAFGKSSFSGNEANRFFLNLGGKQFVDLTGISGLGHRGDGRTLAIWDFDRDGWSDIATINANAPQLLLYHNGIGNLQSAGRHKVIAIEFRGGNQSAAPTSELSNRDGYGAKVTLEIGGRRIVREHQCGEGVFAQNSARMLIGIGDNEAAGKLVVRWPSGKRTELQEVRAGTLVTAYENSTGLAFSQAPYRR